jgi:hypothetical protein
VVLVRFVKNWRNYLVSDRAGWDDDFAKKLVEDLRVAEYIKEGEETPPPDDNLSVDKYADKPSLSKFNRMNADELLALAAKYDIDLGGETQKQHTKPIIQAVLYPETAKDDAE